MKVKLVEAVYKTPYEDYPEVSVIGVFTEREQWEKAIKAYEARKRHWDCACLLENTTYRFTDLTLDDYSKYILPS